MNYLTGLASNCDIPDLCLLSNQDYRHEPLMPGLIFFVWHYWGLNAGPHVC
jgi:hypothetical protein